jgi:hypothetical protein
MLTKQKEIFIIAKNILKEISKVDIDLLLFNLLRLNTYGKVFYKKFVQTIL